MEFLKAFAVIFLLIFGTAMLAYLFWNALKKGYAGKFDIYVKPDENIEDFIIHIRHDAYIGEIRIISDGKSGIAESLAEKYENVKAVNKTDG